MDEWKNILPADSKSLTDDDLLKYLDGTLTEEEKKEVEIKVAGSFESDAVEGLKQIKGKDRIQAHISQINQKLPQILRQKRYRVEKKKLKNIQLTILTIIILLFLCIVTYAVIRMNTKLALGIYNSPVIRSSSLLLIPQA